MSARSQKKADMVQSRCRADMRAAVEPNTKTPLSPGALPAATTVGKPPSACAKRSSEISWNISSYPPHEESRRDPCHRIRQMEAIDPECKTSHQLTGCNVRAVP